MTNEINHAQSLMNLITILVILGGLGILWSSFLEWLYVEKPNKNTKNTRKRSVAKKKRQDKFAK
jgi:hypothetical protein